MTLLKHEGVYMTIGDWADLQPDTLPLLERNWDKLECPTTIEDTYDPYEHRQDQFVNAVIPY